MRAHGTDEASERSGFQWPDPPEPEAFYGLAGRLVEAIAPHTESDPVALLIQLLVFFGNVIGHRPHFKVEASRHGLNLYMVLVGATSKGRKGTALAHIERLFEQCDPNWASGCVVSGLSSGEGLIWAIRDGDGHGQATGTSTATITATATGNDG